MIIRVGRPNDTSPIIPNSGVGGVGGGGGDGGDGGGGGGIESRSPP